MNKFAFLKGRLMGVEKQSISSDKSLHRLEIGVEEFYFNKETEKMMPIVLNYYLKKWEWTDVNNYLIGNEYYFVSDIEYRKVESKSAKKEDGTPFTYGSFDFRCVGIYETKIELMTKLNKSID